MEQDDKVANLDRERASRFLQALSEDPFLCIVVTDEADRRGTPNVTIYSKDISEDHLLRIKSVLEEIQNEKNGA